MKRDKRVRILNIIINLIIGMSLLVFLGLIVGLTVMAKSEAGLKDLFNIIIGLVYVSSFFIAVITLKKILKSIKNKNPFNIDNINHFQTIGYCFIAIALLDGILSYPKANTSGIEIFATSYGSIKPIFLLYLILGIMCFVLGDVFRMALEIKDENDLTV